MWKKKRNAADKKRQILPLLLITVPLLMVVLIIVPLFVILSSEEYEEVAEEAKVETQVDQALSVEDTLNQFFRVIYSYSTSERRFYEGAEPYMTSTAYQSMVPLQDEAEAADSEPMPQKSELQEYTCYYNSVDSRNIGVMAEVWYTVNGTGNFRIMSILKLDMEFSQSDGRWLISKIEPVASHEE